MLQDKDLHISESAVKSLAKNYNTLDYYVKLLELLQSVHPIQKLEKLSKYQLHQVLNQILFNHYHGEEILKYKLCSLYLNKPKIIGAFEIKVNSSRVDFLTINGSTTSFEIKSELDNLSKLRKQMSDYLLAFEYNYLVIDQRHVEKVVDYIPEAFGLWSYNNGKYEKLKRAKLNEEIDPEIQLGLLTKKELREGFEHTNGTSKNILHLHTPLEINQKFKKILKNRYNNRWQFLNDNQGEILPIDFQFFFNTNIKPSHIYYH